MITISIQKLCISLLQWRILFSFFTLDIRIVGTCLFVLNYAYNILFLEYLATGYIGINLVKVILAHVVPRASVGILQNVAAIQKSY